jgi:hypothetical protein
VAMPQLGLANYLTHVLRIWPSVVAFLKPCFVRGCFAGLEHAGSPQLHLPPCGTWMGNTGQFLLAAASASSNAVRVLVITARPHRLHRLEPSPI